MCAELNDELDKGSQLAIQLVDHVTAMGAGSCAIPVLDRAEEYIVVVLPKRMYDDAQKKLDHGI